MQPLLAAALIATSIRSIAFRKTALHTPTCIGISGDNSGARDFYAQARLAPFGVSVRIKTMLRIKSEAVCVLMKHPAPSRPS
ncbi:MAG: hypothetical protein BGN91_13620 [Nitrobacter sp. 62-13]|nr:MAG: hypothetical protein BGN91_13620 [Nitrobacter sp. 62-13]